MNPTRRKNLYLFAGMILGAVCGVLLFLAFARVADMLQGPAPDDYAETFFMVVYSVVAAIVGSSIGVCVMLFLLRPKK